MWLKLQNSNAGAVGWIPTHITSYTHTHTHTEILSHKKKNETLPFATMWMDMEGIRLSEISQTDKDKYSLYYYLHVASKQ